MSYTASKAVSVAKSQVGVKEKGTNDTKYNRWLGTIPGYPHGGYGYPWCQSFQSWVADQAGGEAGKDYPRTAGCAVAVRWFKDKGRFSQTPRVGSQVFYGPGGATHVELVVAVDGDSITTVGGNTTGNIGDGRYANGDAVCRKVIARSNSRIYGYGHPVYDNEPAPKPVPVTAPNGTPVLKKGASGDRVKQLQRALVKVGEKLPKFGADGDYGNETVAAVKSFQGKHKLTKDGQYGERTEAALKAALAKVK